MSRFNVSKNYERVPQKPDRLDEPAAGNTVPVDVRVSPTESTSSFELSVYSRDARRPSAYSLYSSTHNVDRRPSLCNSYDRKSHGDDDDDDETGTPAGTGVVVDAAVVGNHIRGDELAADVVDADIVDSTSTIRSPSSRRASVAVAHRGMQLARGRHQRRLVSKNGMCNVSSRNAKRSYGYLVDIFTTLVDMKWRYLLLMFLIGFVGSWVFFATIWWLYAIANEDYRALNDTSWTPCVANVFDFQTALLFSIETQHTIGYGTRALETHCPSTVVVLMVQCCCGVFVQSLMTGLIFAKLSRPKHRAQTMMFSKFAVVCMRDGEYVLLFRVGDMRRSHIIATSVRALLVRNRLTKENETIPLCQYTLKLETDTNFGDNFVFLVWPVTVAHRINADSPLWELSEEELLNERLEIIIILEGVVENTGNTTQFRTSYLPGEIMWGCRLKPLVTKERGGYDIDFKQFDVVEQVSGMPSCSAAQFSRLRDVRRRRDSDADDALRSPTFTAHEATAPVTFRKSSFFPRKFGLIGRRSRKRKVSIVGGTNGHKAFSVEVVPEVKSPPPDAVPKRGDDADDVSGLLADANKNFSNNVKHRV